MTIIGLIQNSGWFQNITDAIVLLQIKPYFIGRELAGGMIVLGQYIFFYNILMTFRGRLKQPKRPLLLHLSCKEISILNPHYMTL